MQLTARKITVGVLSSTVVVGLTAVTGWAFAADTGTSSTTSSPVQLIVGYRKGGDASAAVRIMNAMGAQLTAKGAGATALDALGATTVRVPKSRSASLIAQLKADPGVSYVEVDHTVKVSEVTPNDPEYLNQSELRGVKLPAAWDVTTGSTVKVAVVDTGVTEVPDLAGAVLPGYDFVNLDTAPNDDLTDRGVNVGHGTTVASLIAARTNNATEIAGVCWECQILPVKVLDSTGFGYYSTVAQGIIYAVHQGAKIINLSLGGEDYSQVLADAVAYANSNSVLVVAAAGNENSSVKQYPAAFGDVLAVGATDPGDSTTRAYFSSYNLGTSKWVDVAAPGTVDALQPYDGKAHPGLEGTSFSTPIVTGIAALVKSYRPSYTGWSLMYAIESSATPIGAWVTKGKVNAAKALTMGTDTTKPTSSGISPGSYAKVRGTVTVTPVGLKDNYSGILKVELFVDGVWKNWTKTAPYSVKWNSAGRNGNVKLRLRIYDKAGNVIYLDRVVVADNTPPAVRITSAPKSGNKISGTVKVYYTGSDKYGIKFYQLLVNGKVVQQHQTTSVPFSFVASKYPKTNIRVQVRAYDVAGNSSTTAARVYHR